MALAQTNSTAKIAPRVMAETANGHSTEALVVLTEQADLRPAAGLQTKLDKGTFVFNTLREVANRTQAPILRMLDSMGIAHQSFYIVNLIEVTGGRNVMEQLAARSDVAKIEANPHVTTALPHSNQMTTQATRTRLSGTLRVSRLRMSGTWASRGRVWWLADADTGVQWDHPALKSHYRGWNGTSVNHDYNWHDATAALRDAGGSQQPWHLHRQRNGGRRRPGQSDRCGARREVDRLPQHGFGRQRFAGQLHGMFPVPDRSLSGEWRSRTREIRRRPLTPSTTRGFARRAKAARSTPCRHRGSGARCRNLPCDGGRQRRPGMFERSMYPPAIYAAR